METTDREVTTGVSDELGAAWPQIHALSKAVMFGAFATVSAEGAPHVTPIGSIVLRRDEPRGYYHPKLTARLPRALDAGGRFQLLLVDPRITSWLPPLIRGEFKRLVAVRLRGHALPRREADQEEAARWRRRVRAVSWTRGYDLLWKEMRFVQDLVFDGMVPIRFGAMKHG